MINLSPSSPLDWIIDFPERETRNLHLNFDLHNSEFRFRDPVQFHSCALGVETLSERITNHTHQIKSVILYEGDACFSLAISKDLSLLEDFDEWCKDYCFSRNFLLRLFSMEILMEYLHRLASYLPEEVKARVILDLSDTKRPSYQAYLLSQELFSYIEVEAKGVNIPYTKENIDSVQVGVLLPQLTRANLDDLDEVLHTLNNHQLNYIIFPESLATASWQGLDSIIVFSNALDNDSLRILQGFVAAEGHIISYGKSLNLEGERSFQIWLDSIK